MTTRFCILAVAICLTLGFHGAAADDKAVTEATLADKIEALEAKTKTLSEDIARKEREIDDIGEALISGELRAQEWARMLDTRKTVLAPTEPAKMPEHRRQVEKLETELASELANIATLERRLAAAKTALDATQAGLQAARKQLDAARVAKSAAKETPAKEAPANETPVEQARPEIGFHRAANEWVFESDPDKVFEIMIDRGPDRLYARGTQGWTWEGRYKPPGAGRDSSRPLVRFTYTPKPEDMRKKIPGDVRRKLRGKLQFVLDVNATGDAADPVLELKWFKGEVDWDEATVIGPGAPSSFRLRLPCTSNSGKTELAPLCADRCTQKFWKWDFYSTNYNVKYSLGKGEHQGNQIFGRLYRYDPRFPVTRGEPAPWNSTNKIVAARWKAVPEVEKAALCEVQELMKTDIYNHGRTLAHKMSEHILDDRDQVPVSSVLRTSVGPLDYEAWKSGPPQRVGALNACFKRIPDGYCDHVCGNCSYVLPDEEFGIELVRKESSLAIDYEGTREKITKRGEGFRKPEVKFFSRREGDPGEERTVRYNRGLIYKWTATGLGAAPRAAQNFLDYASPFTSCYDRNSKFPQFGYVVGSPTETGLFPDWAPVETGVITGLWGHNSNTDAEAEAKQFEACVEDPNVRADMACEECGTPRKAADGTPVQWPCLDKSNKAEPKWSRRDGTHNVWDDRPGGLGGRPPYCKGDKKYPVHGM